MPYPEVPATLGDHLRKRRHERGLLQNDAADRLGVNAWKLANWEKGYTSPKLRSWRGVIEFLGCDPTPEPEGPGQRKFSACRRQGLPLRALAKQLGVDPETLQRWERGTRILRGRWLELVEESLRGR
jgi:transcriptional regulator with XRE-family HTH domain